MYLPVTILSVVGMFGKQTSTQSLSSSWDPNNDKMCVFSFKEKDIMEKIGLNIFWNNQYGWLDSKKRTILHQHALSNKVKNEDSWLQCLAFFVFFFFFFFFLVCFTTQFKSSSWGDTNFVFLHVFGLENTISTSLSFSLSLCLSIVLPPHRHLTQGGLIRFGQSGIFMTLPFSYSLT